MAKKLIYVCQQCGNTSVKWQGKCHSCGSWNSYVEELVDKKTAAKGNILKAFEENIPERLEDYNLEQLERIITSDPELNRVLGGGIVPGSIILAGGEPGIGKSTLLLQLALRLKNATILYVSGEESVNQIKMRASRIAPPNPNCYLLAETSLESIRDQVKNLKPDLLVIDSIQTMVSLDVDATAGSIPQIRECASSLQQLAKKEGLTVFLIGHITKEGYIAGPKLLEHLVDTVLYFEGDRHYNYRILRTVKNRFGSVAEIGIYEMLTEGLKPVKNPSEILLSHREEKLSGTAIAAMIEGIRPILIEIQALVTPSFYGMPQRSCTGFDNRRLNMLLAVLEKRCGLQLSNQDVFLNIAGGLRVEEPSIDLAVVVAIASSYHDKAVDDHYCFAGEVGLSGELRPVNRIAQRIQEAEKLGFKKMFISSHNKLENTETGKIVVIEKATVYELLKYIFQE